MKTLDGMVYSHGTFFRGHAAVYGDRAEISEGPCKGAPDASGLILPALVDCHTHCADAGVKPRLGMTLEELVAPPNGLKHVYLRTAPRDRIVSDMHDFSICARRNGISAFVDFREGGAEGCRMLREACPNAVVLGRPVSPEFDPCEVSEILSCADGIALSSVSDLDPKYAEKVADATHKAGKAFAIHASERIREDIDTVLSLEPSFVVHMIEASCGDMSKCADANVPAVVCPRSNRFFGKVPPIKRMIDSGISVSLGTDNAMLCSPDLRPEAALFSDILADQGGDPSDTWVCLAENGKKLLNQIRKIPAPVGEDVAFTVLPCSGNNLESALDCFEPAFLV